MIRLFINYYEDPRPERQAELLECICRNLINPYIDKIHILIDDPAPEEFNSDKIVLHEIDTRPTYDDFIKIIKSVSIPEDVNIISNTDIWFDDSISLIENIEHNALYALSRYDDNILWDHADSQDCWIFRLPIDIQLPFKLGIPGCDNRLLYLFHKAGWKISNSALSIRTHHIHRSNIRNYKSTDQVPGPYGLCHPAPLGHEYRIVDNGNINLI